MKVTGCVTQKDASPSGSSLLSLLPTWMTQAAFFHPEPSTVPFLCWSWLVRSEASATVSQRKFLFLQVVDVSSASQQVHLKKRLRHIPAPKYSDGLRSNKWLLHFLLSRWTAPVVPSWINPDLGTCCKDPDQRTWSYARTWSYTLASSTWMTAEE